MITPTFFASARSPRARPCRGKALLEFLGERPDNSAPAWQRPLGSYVSDLARRSTPATPLANLLDRIGRDGSDIAHDDGSLRFSGGLPESAAAGPSEGVKVLPPDRAL